MTKTLTIAILAAISGSATAGLSESFSGSFGLATTNWTEAFSINGFDTRGGNRELLEVNIHLTGDVNGIAMAESLDASPATIELNLQATLTLFLAASNTELAEVIPVVNTTFDAAAFDGDNDFAGTSGAVFSGLNNSASVWEAISDAGVLALFTDVASIELSAEAFGSSFGSGAGNLITQFATEAGLGWEVEYKFREVPAPAGMALLGMGGLVTTRRRR